MRRDDFKQLLQRRILVGDGATGTLLREMGALTGDGCPDLLNLTAPEAVQQVHARYFAVGADLVHTNTFGANRLKLANTMPPSTWARSISEALIWLDKQLQPTAAVW